MLKRSYLAYRFGEHVLERRHAGAEMPDLHLVLRGKTEQEARAAFVGHEDAHDILLGLVTLEAGRAHRDEKRLGVALHTQLEDTPAGALQFGDRTSRSHSAL